MADLRDSVIKIIYFVGIVSRQEISSSMSHNSILKSIFDLPVVQEVPSLNVPLDEENFSCEKLFLELDLVSCLMDFGHG